MLKTLVATTALVLLLLPLSAHANLIWDWTGDCERITQPPTVPLCTHATLHVVTTDAYIPGEEVWPHIPPGPDPILLEALYSDGNTRFNLGYPWLTDGSGSLKVLMAQPHHEIPNVTVTTEFLRALGS